MNSVAGVVIAALASPVLVIFLSSNLVNLGNLGFNMLFSRWMGPELFGDLALLLTIKLGLLGVLGAVQIAVSNLVAKQSGSAFLQLEGSLSRINRFAFISLWFALPLVVTALWYGSAGERLGLGSPSLLLILCGSLPFTAPLCLLRGVAIGKLDTAQIVLSANIEMGVRLLGAVFAWQAGFGIEGVVVAMVASIVAGWFPLRNTLAATSQTAAPQCGHATALAVAALPFAALQIAQVCLLDGDVVIAKIALGSADAGYVAALSLFQRIQFYGCFGLASVLLPTVAMAASSGRSTLRAAAPVLAIFAIISVFVQAATLIAPRLMVTLLVGEAFAPVAPILFLAGATAIAFTYSYLAATYLAALGDRSGIWCIVAASPVQIFAIVNTASGANADLASFLHAKLACQLCLALLITVFLVQSALRKPVQSQAIPPVTA